VVNTAATPVGTVNAGVDVVIGDADVFATDGTTPVDTVESEGSVSLPQSVIKYKDAANADAVTAPSNTNFDDATNLNPALQIPRRELFDDDSNPLGLYVTAADLIADTVPQVPAIITGDPIIYAFGRSLHSGQTTSYRTGDEGNMLATGWFDYSPPVGQNSIVQRRTNWLTLAHTNSFGNTNRFTDETGAAFATSGNRMFIDHLTGIMWFAFNAFVGSVNWNTAIDDAVAHSFGGFTDWRLPPVLVMQTVIQRQGNVLSYGPFNVSGTSNHRLSTTVPSATANDYLLGTYNSGGVFPTTAKTAIGATIGYQFLVRRWIP
jgi:hypothetical protein